ncbi:hypothetical protein PRIPAC_80793 [Pristionchus pacificus]|uniref:G protein-coupled receptor n=1 Tax=Pristionchus pacificus TaxID=54126 RepID=A0A2A6C3A1_PRIPA|nr:hypothetical protein PRIPAC_80793 [Pristionchus pacificus]|eukprot:PDM72655.1 G protein-coupled receptor [Pristionchus pacificus]
MSFAPTTGEEVSEVPQWLPIWEWPSMPEYNCSRVRPVGAEWTESKGHPHPYLGYWSVFWGVTCEIFYVPCIYALFMERKHACYRIMLWLAIIDIIAILCNSIGFGLFMIEGTVFCSRPWSVWLVGCVGLGMWCGACVGCLLLVTYRIFELMNMSKRFESRTNILIVFASCYALYFAFLTPPILMNSEYNAMFYDPFIGDVPSQVYVNWPHTANNLLIVMTSASLYIFLIVVLLTKQGAMSSEAGRARMSANAPIFVQASLICVFNVAASLEYIYMNFFPTPQILIELGHLSWQISHGVPPFIYLLLNKTVKRHTKYMFGRKKKISPSKISLTTTFSQWRTRNVTKRSY